MINKTIQNKKLQQNQHELLIINNLKQLSNFSLYSENKIKSDISFLHSNWTSKFTSVNLDINLQTKKESTLFSFHNVDKQKITNNLIKKSPNYQWLNYFLYNNPINLLFSIDQFLFEFAKKQPQRRKSSEFQQQLKERKKLTLFYGHLSKKQLQNLVSQSKSYQGYFSKNFFSILERRLDVLLYRSGLVKNIITARQLISHKKITVNNKILNSASYQVNPGDIISILSREKKSTQFSETICTIFKKRRSHFSVSPNFLYKLQNVKNIKNFKQKKIVENSIRLLLTRIQNRAHLSIENREKRIKKSPILFFDLISKSKTISFLPSLYQLHRKTFSKRKKLILLKLKPLVSKQAKSFLLIYKQKNYLSRDRKPLFQNKYTRFINLLERNVSLISRYGVKNQQLTKDKKQFNYQKKQENIPSFQKSKNAFFYEKKYSDKWKNKDNNRVKSFTRKLSNSTSLQKNSFFVTSSIYNRKRILAIYRNSVYKTLLQMYSMPFYFVFFNQQNNIKNRLFFDSIKKQSSLLSENIQKKRIKSLLTLKLKKYSAKKRSRKQTLRALRFVGIKPMHMEVSYSLSTVILLFSPQRLNFPFYIDIDLVLRSFR